MLRSYEIVHQPQDQRIVLRYDAKQYPPISDWQLVEVFKYSPNAQKIRQHLSALSLILFLLMTVTLFLSGVWVAGIIGLTLPFPTIVGRYFVSDVTTALRRAETRKQELITIDELVSSV